MCYRMGGSTGTKSLIPLVRSPRRKLHVRHEKAGVHRATRRRGGCAQRLKYSFTAVEHGQKLRRYMTNACRSCAIKEQCTTGKERRITRWEHEHVIEAVQQRLDEDPQAMRRRRETVEHPFGTLKMRMGATHFLMKTLPKVASEMAHRATAYNLTRAMNIVGTRALLAAIRA